MRVRPVSYCSCAQLGRWRWGLGLGRAAFETRYVTLSVPGLCAVYLAWTVYGSASLRKGCADIIVRDRSRRVRAQHVLGVAVGPVSKVESRAV